MVRVGILTRPSCTALGPLCFGDQRSSSARSVLDLHLFCFFQAQIITDRKGYHGDNLDTSTADQYRGNSLQVVLVKRIAWRRPVAAEESREPAALQFVQSYRSLFVPSALDTISIPLRTDLDLFILSSRQRSCHLTLKIQNTNAASLKLLTHAYTSSPPLVLHFSYLQPRRRDLNACYK
ncbi:hypothetical protein BDR05DRAFT_81296 [Suillus weaverae]|nr:hypothetical protein BDR05DRAFT_81296 [Suillus weaverae]